MEVMGLPLLIQWHKFQPGTSFFIPCIERRPVEAFVRAEARRLNLRVLTKRVVESGVLGLRVWRLSASIRPHSSLPVRS